MSAAPHPEPAVAVPAIVEADQPAPQPRTPRWIEDAEEISKLLVLVASQRLMLAVGGPGGARNSLLLGADPATQQLIIDPPFPPLHQALKTGSLLSLSTRIDGAVLDFSAAFEARVELGGEDALVLRWPQRLRYLQRRSAYRLGIPHELQVPPAVLRDSKGPLTATLVDLSRFGAGATVSRSVRPLEGEEVACTIRVGEVEFTATAEVRSCVTNLDRMRLGLQFSEVSAATAARLSAAVAKLERVSLRKAAERRTRS